MTTTPTVLDDFLRASSLQNAGAPVPVQPVTNFTGSGVSVTPDPDNGRNIVHIVAGSGGGSTETTTSFVQPAVGATVTVHVDDSTAAVAGNAAGVAGGGYYLVDSVPGGGASVVLRNTGGAGNANVGATVATTPATVTFGGSVMPAAPAAPQVGQAGVVQADKTIKYVGHREIINAASFGATGTTDGTHDDYAAIQAALDSVLPGQQIEVFLPKHGLASYDTLCQPYQQPCKMYAVSQPLSVNDTFTGGTFQIIGSSCTRFRGESQDSVGIMPTTTSANQPFQPTYLGPTIICGTVADDGQAQYVTDSGQVCIVGGSSLAPYAPCLLMTDYDIGEINNLSAFCFRMMFNPTTDTLGTGATREIASVYGALGNIESHLSFTIKRSNSGSGTQVIAQLCTTGGGGNTTTTGAQVWPAQNVSTLIAFGSTANMVAGSLTTIDGFGSPPQYAAVLETISVADPTHAWVVNRNPDWIVAGGTALPNGTVARKEGLTTVSTSAGRDLAAGSLKEVAVTWDGTTLRLFLDGAQPDSSMTATTLGSGGWILQKFYEEFVLLQPSFNVYPHTSGAQYIAMPLFHQGRTQLLNAATYTAPYTPNSAAWTCNSNTKFLWDPAVSSPHANGYVNRDSYDRAYTIARTGANSLGRPRTNLPVWLRLYMTLTPYTTGAEVSDLFVFNPQGHSLLGCASTNLSLHHLRFAHATCGIQLTNFAYFPKIWDCSFVLMGGAGSYLSCNILDGDGVQGVYIGQGIHTASNSTNIHVLHTYSDLFMSQAFPAGQGQACIVLSGNVATCVIQGVVFDDENGSARYAAVVLANVGSFKYFSGSLFTDNGSSPHFKIGVCLDADISCSAFGGTSPQPIFSFGPTKNAGGLIRWSGQGTSQPPVIDPVHPGSVIVPRQQSGAKTLTFPTDADYTVPQGTLLAFWLRYFIANGVITADHRKVIMPANPGAVYEFKNLNTTWIVDIATLSGAAVVSVAPGAKVIVQDQPTGMVQF